MAEKRAETILIWMQVIQEATLKRAFEGLTQDEFMWKPHPGAWGIARREECQTPTPLGASESEWVADYDTEVEKEGNDAVDPMTTIAWLLNHFGAAPGTAAQLEFLGGTIEPSWPVYRRMWWPVVISTADDAVARFRDGWSDLERALTAATDEMLEREYAREEFPWSPVYRLLSLIATEVDHHGTQICVLRDLYAHR